MAEEKLEAKIGLDSSGFNKAIDDAKNKVDSFGKDGKKAINAMEAAANNINLSALKGAFGEVAGAISEDLKKPVTDIGELVGGIANAVMTGRWDQAISGGIKLIADAINKARKEAEEYQKRLDELDKQRAAAEAGKYKAEAQGLVKLNALNNGTMTSATAAEIQRLVGLLNQQGYNLGIGADGRAVGVGSAFAALEEKITASDLAPYKEAKAAAEAARQNAGTKLTEAEDVMNKARAAAEIGANTPAAAALLIAAGNAETAYNKAKKKYDEAVATEDIKRKELELEELNKQLVLQGPSILVKEAEMRANAEAASAEAARLARIEAWKNSPAGREADIMLKRDAALQEFNNLTNWGRLPRTALKAGDLKRADQLANDLRMYDKQLMELASQTNWLGKIYDKLPPVQNQ